MPFARLDQHRQDVLFGWEGTGGERRECARRVDRLVEVEFDAPVLGEFRVEEPAGRVSVRAGRLVFEDEEQFCGPRLGDRIESERLAVQRELDVARARHRRNITDPRRQWLSAWAG
jgi:hypothetical protein